MSFTLRQIARRAGSGEIVRTRRIEAEALTIGRGADCDIQLPDLAVGLRHAVLRQTGPDRVLAEALGGQSLQVDGRFEPRRELRLDRPAVLVLGGHHLLLEAGEEPGEVVVTVRAALAEAGEAEAERLGAAPRRPLLGRRGLAWILGLGVLAAGLIAPVAVFLGLANPRIHPDRQWSTAPLSQAHAFLETDCQSCHQKAFVAVRDEACLSCHQAGTNGAARARRAGAPVAPILVGAHAEAVKLSRAAPPPPGLAAQAAVLVGRAFHHPNDRCASCHLEHGHVPETGVARTGLEPIPFLAPTLSCVQCHADMRRRLGDAAVRDVPDWSRHPDFRAVLEVSKGVALERVALTAGARQMTGLRFSHRLHLEPAGGVARMGQVLGRSRGYGGALDCGGCHGPASRGGGFRPVEMERDCGACHSLAFARGAAGVEKLPHGDPKAVVARLRAFYGEGGGGAAQPRRVRPGLFDLGRFFAPPARTPAMTEGAVRRAFSDGGTCGLCHAVDRPAEPASLAFRVAPVAVPHRYLPNGSFDHRLKAHSEDRAGAPTCGACHKAESSKEASDLMLPGIAECATCHGKAGTAAAREARIQPAGADCGLCHSYHAPGTPERRPPQIGPVALEARAGP